MNKMRVFVYKYNDRSDGWRHKWDKDVVTVIDKNNEEILGWDREWVIFYIGQTLFLQAASLDSNC